MISIVYLQKIKLIMSQNSHFNNTKVAFSLKNNFELNRAYFLFKMLSYQALVSVGSSLTNIALNLNLPVKGLIRKTVFNHFCGGISEKDCIPTIDKMYTKKVCSVLDYSVEGKEEEIQFDSARDKILEIIDFADKKEAMPIVVFKPTGFGRFALFQKIGENKTLTEEEKAEGKSLTLTPDYANRRIGNIFLGVDFVNDVYKSVFKDDKASIGDFLNTLLAAISEECPSHNFGLITDQENTNIVYIIDLPMTTKDMSDMEIYYEDLFKFNVLSNDSIIRDFKYSTQIPSALKATIAINAQSGAGSEDVDSLTFAAFNRSIKSRIASNDEKFSEEEEKTYFNENNAREEREKRLATLKSQIKQYHDGFFNSFETEDQNQEFTSIVANIKSIIKEAQSIENYKLEASDNFTNNQAIVPIDLNLKMDG